MPRGGYHGPPAGEAQRATKQDIRNFIQAVKDDLKLSRPRGYEAIAAEMGVKRATAYSRVRAAAKRGEFKWSEVRTPRRVLRRDEAMRIRPEVLELVKKGHTTAYIAELLVMSPGTVQRWRKQFREEGLLDVPDEKTLEQMDPIPWDDLDPESRDLLEDFGKFRPEVMGRESPPWATETATALVRLYLSREDEYAIVNAPPGVGKSTLITYDFMVWVAARERAQGRELSVVLGHAATDRARLYLQRIRRTFESNDTLIRRFGRFRSRYPGDRWTRDEIDIEPLHRVSLAEKEPTFGTASYERTLLSVRAKIQCWDDLIDKGNSGSAEQRQALLDWWEQFPETRMNEGGLIILSNARYGPEDLSWSLRQSVDPDEIDEDDEPRPIYTHVNWRAHYDELCTPDPAKPGKMAHAGDWPNGCLLDETRLGWRKMRKARQNERRYRLVYLSEDTDPVGFLAQRAWFEGGKDNRGAEAPGCFNPNVRFGQLYRPEAPALSICTVDPSGSNYWAVMHIVAWPDRTHQLVRGYRRILKAPDLLYRERDGSYSGLVHEMWTAAQAEEVPFRYLVTEQTAQQRWLTQYPFVREWAQEHAVSLIPHETTRHSKPDPDRGVEMLAPIYQHGRVVIPYGGHEEQIFAEAWAREACAWPEGSTSDIVMAHWFYTFREETLLAFYLAQEVDEDYGETGPGWKHVATPSWASKRLAELSSA